VTEHTLEIAVSYNVTHKVAVPILHGVVFYNPVLQPCFPWRNRSILHIPMNAHL